MTDKEAYRLIGEKAAELASKPEVQEKMVQIAKAKGKEEAERWLYLLAIAVLAF
jgi:hypothetical protein